MKTIAILSIVVAALAMSLSASAIDSKFKKDKTGVDDITNTLNAKKQSAVIVRGEQPYVGDIVIPEKITVDSVTFFTYFSLALSTPRALNSSSCFLMASCSLMYFTMTPLRSLALLKSSRIDFIVSSSM